MFKKIFIIIIIFINSASNIALADSNTLPKVRVFYRPDGGVSVMRVIADSCGGLSEKECLDRETKKGEFKNLPYDDIAESDLPKGRENRDKWRGEKGKGIWIDDKLVTKSEKMQELQKKLAEELEKDNPNDKKISNLQISIERLKNIKAENNLLSKNQLAKIEVKDKGGLLAGAAGALSEAFETILNSIKDGVLALKQLVTDTLKVGSKEKPAGITVYDQATKEPHCLVVENGKVETIPGECGSPKPKPASSSGSSSSSSATSTATSTPQ
jgi:hypothetical protein